MARVFDVSLAPTVTAGGYSDGDVVGGLQTITIPYVNDVNQVWLKQVRIRDDAAAPNVSDMRLHFYSAAPTTIADNAAWARTDADLAKWVGSVDVTTFVANGVVNSSALVTGLSVAIPLLGGVIYMYIEVNDASPPTYSATNDLVLQLLFSDEA